MTINSYFLENGVRLEHKVKARFGRLASEAAKAENVPRFKAMEGRFLVWHYPTEWLLTFMNAIIRKI